MVIVMEYLNGGSLTAYLRQTHLVISDEEASEVMK